MKIGILKTDAVRPEWVSEYGEYPDMFMSLMRQVDADLEFEVWDVEEGEFPDDIDAVDAYIITGSKSSVYEDKLWIRDLEDFIRKLDDQRKTTVGICFGHQAVAKALGGVVDKSPKGWGVGLHTYDITDDSLLEEGDDGKLKLIVSHQDQVVRPPEGAEVFAQNDHCEIAALKIGEHILTFQGHPEFNADYSREIMNLRQDMIGDDRVAEGKDSLETADHEGVRAARWMLDLFKRG